MRISRLKLTDFRSYAALDLMPGGEICVLVGKNAAGKTNVLEAIHLCALGRSHRTPRDADLIAFGAQGAFVGADVETRTGTRRIECRMRQGERKRMRVDGKELVRSGELMGCLNVVMFSPEDLQLVKGEPAQRRRFLDMELSQIQPAYYYRLQQYNAALKQRNALLKAPDVKPEALETWDALLASFACQIITARAQFLERLAAIAAELHRGLTLGSESFRVGYAPNVPPDEAQALENTLLTRLYDAREKDLQRGFTSVGPHKDDIEVVIGGKDARVFGSQGQQRTAALSLKLSELALMREETQELPVLLLDDVFSELDEGRRAMLTDVMKPCQTFITCTDLADAALGGRKAQVLRVEPGRIVVEST